MSNRLSATPIHTTGKPTPPREIAHALNNVAAVIASTVQLLSGRASSVSEQSLFALLGHAAREIEGLSSRVAGLSMTPALVSNGETVGSNPRKLLRAICAPPASEGIEACAEAFAQLLDAAG
jgi:hypothetical protein